MLLDVIADRVLLETADPAGPAASPTGWRWPTMAVLRRRLVPLRIIEPWLARIAAAATARGPADRDPYLTTGNPEAFLRALHLQVALAPEPIDVRADLLLDARRRAAHHQRGVPRRAAASTAPVTGR